MRLDIQPEVFASGDQLSVLKLLDLVMIGRHDWRPGPLVLASAERFAESVPMSGVREFIKKAFVEAGSAARKAPATALITVADLKELLADLSRPAVLVVEDEITEESFLLALATAFGESPIVRALKEDWLTLGHAGGKDRMAQFVARRRQRFFLVVRVAALLDSDQKSPEHRTRNHTYVARIKAIDGVKEVHMWRCRELENYVPCRVWEHHFPNRGPKVDKLRAMIPQQRHYLDVKKHFGDSVKPPLIPEELALTEEDFAELGPDVVAELRELLAMIHRIL